MVRGRSTSHFHPGESDPKSKAVILCGMFEFSGSSNRCRPSVTVGGRAAQGRTVQTSCISGNLCNSHERTVWLRHGRARRWSFVIALLFVLIGAGLASAGDRVVVEWLFDKDGDFAGWAANGHIRDAHVSHGVLSGRVVGGDPILEYQPLLHISASPWQMIEIRLKADRDGLAQVFWSNTREGRYSGFSGDKTTDFNVVGDGEWHAYRLLPFWHKEGKIVRLRLDLADGMQFWVDSIRIVEMEMPEPVKALDFDFGRGPDGWQPIGSAQLCTNNGTMVLRMQKPADFLLSPPINFDALENSFVAVRMSTAAGRYGRIFFATDKSHGLHWLDFPITGDGRQRIYNVDMLEAKEWDGRVLALGLRPTDALESQATVRSIRIACEPQGPPRLSLQVFALDDAAPRVGVPARISAVVYNAGGATASNVQFQLSLPAGLRLLETNAQTTPLRRLGVDEETTASWRVVADCGLTNAIKLRVTADGAESVTTFESVQVPARKPLGVESGGSYVPQPGPVHGRIDVGVYYFPGWRDASQWKPILRFPERKPIPGWYREGSPEVADWHIKWAVEHGITFFAYDWYWARGGRQLEHALHEGFFHARYRHLLKFCLLWANHNPPNTHSLDDSVAVARYWITNYFNRPEYYRIEGKPVIIIFSPYNFRADLGVDGTRQALNAMREECRRAGLNGLYMVACVSGPREVEDEGYDAVTCYNWAGLGLIGPEKHGPFSALIEGYRRQWETFIEQSRLPIILPISGGWDSRPWHGNNAMVRHGRTPAMFKRHLQQARDMLEHCADKTKLLPAVIIEAWNEWGEGSYIEPHKEYGFGYLDAVRDVFTDEAPEHEDLVPNDVGIGPYDVPPEQPVRTAWTFDRDTDGWNNNMQCDSVGQTEGALVAETVGGDPALFGPPIQAMATSFPVVRLRMRLCSKDGAPFSDTAQLFWRTKRWTENEACSIRFAVSVDGQWHQYQLPVSENPRWKGVITRLRLDPCTRAGVRVELDEIRLEAL